MAHWLMKSEPESYGWDDLVRDGGTEWDGVRNNAARLHLKAMKAGDEAFFYHSMSDKAVVGIMRVARGAAPDPKDARLGVGPGRAGAQAARPVTLAEIKAEPALAKMELIRQSRLSVAPVSGRGMEGDPGDGRPLRPGRAAARNCRKVSGGRVRLASSHATTSQTCSSDSEFRHDGMPVILIPFLAIQNSSRGFHLSGSRRANRAGSAPSR